MEVQFGSSGLTSMDGKLFFLVTDKNSFYLLLSSLVQISCIMDGMSRKLHR